MKLQVGELSKRKQRHYRGEGYVVLWIWGAMDMG